MLRRLKNISVWCLIMTLAFVYANNQTLAQTKRVKKPVVKKTQKPVCQVNSLVFKCPDDFSKPEKINENTVFLKIDYEGSVTYLVVSVSNTNFEESLTEDLAKRVAAKLVEGNAQPFVWKNIDPTLMDVDSKYEKSAKNIQGFNNKIRVNFVSRLFAFNKKHIYVGYGYKMDEGTDGREAFELGLGGDNAIGCNALAEIIFSITKEKSKDDTNCTLTMSIGD